MKISSSIPFLSFAALLFFTPALPAQTVEALMQKGDAYDRKFQAAEALQNYLPAEKAEPKNVPLLLRIARQYRHMMTDAPSVNEKLKLGNTALAYAQRAAALAPNDSDAQLSPAITYGKMVTYLGTKEQVAASPMIKAGADRALKLNPQNDDAWYVLGRWHLGLASITGIKRAMGKLIYGDLPVTTNEAGVACFENCVKINPKRLRSYIELGRAYAEMGQKETARKFIEKGLAMPSLEKDDWDAKSRGRAILDKL